jgi:hypothetical protein
VHTGRQPQGRRPRVYGSVCQPVGKCKGRSVWLFFLRRPLERLRRCTSSGRWSCCRREYRPFCASSSSCVPRSTMRPWSSTRMTLAFLIVAIRCEITNVVLPERRRSQCQVRHRRAKRKVPSIVFGAFRGAKKGKAPRQRWHSWHPWQCGLCNLQNLKEGRETESLSLRQ